MPDTTIHDWLRPRLEALVAEAAQGFDGQAVLATLIDLADEQDAPPAAP